MPDREMGSCYAFTRILPGWTDQMEITLNATTKWFTVNNNHNETVCWRYILPVHSRTSEDIVCHSCRKQEAEVLCLCPRDPQFVEKLSGKVKHELQITSYEFRSTSYEFQVTSLNLRVKSSNSRVRRLKARVVRLKVRVARLKARVAD